MIEDPVPARAWVSREVERRFRAALPTHRSAGLELGFVDAYSAKLDEVRIVTYVDLHLTEVHTIRRTPGSEGLTGEQLDEGFALANKLLQLI
jgi:hypothetical protein